MAPVETYRSKEAYRKNLAYRHIHGIPTHAVDVVVAGKKHKVDHSGKKHKGGVHKVGMSTIGGKKRPRRKRA